MSARAKDPAFGPETLGLRVCLAVAGSAANKLIRERRLDHDIGLAFATIGVGHLEKSGQTREQIHELVDVLLDSLERAGRKVSS